MQTLQIQKLVDNYGKEKTRSYLVKRFARPEAIVEFKNLFPNHITTQSPPFHKEILSEIPKGGKQANAAPRGFAKSTIIDVIGAGWLAVNSHYHFILIISDTYTQAKMHLGALKDEFETNAWLNWLYGNLKGSVWGEDRIIVKGRDGPVMIMALGAGMKIRGLKFRQYRPELAIIDDLENTEMVYSADRRQKLERWFNFDLMPALAVPKNVMYLGTILHYNALLKKVIDKAGKYQGWKTGLYKALTDGESLWPTQYTTKYLTAIRDDPTHPDYVGSIVFSQEYQNEPQDDQDRIIRLEWVKYYTYAAKFKEFDGIHDIQRKESFRKSLKVFAGVDPAIGEKEQSDNFSMYVFGLDEKTGMEYQLDLIHGKFTIDDQVERIVNCCKLWDIDVLGIESNAYQAGLYQLVRLALQKAGMKTKLRKIITDRDKIRRARIHSVAFEGGFVKLRQDHKNVDIIKKEIEEFPLGEHDDAFDSLMLAREARQKPKPRAFTKKLKGF